MYLWMISADFPPHHIGSYMRKNSPDRFIYKKCVSAGTAGVPSFEFDASSSEVRSYDDLANNAMVPLVSARIQKILVEVAGDDVELIPAHIVAADGEVEGYALVNVMAKVHATDRTMSEFTLVPGTEAIMGFRKLVLVDGSLGTHALARDTEYSSNLVVSERLAVRLRKEAGDAIGLFLPSEVPW